MDVGLKNTITEGGVWRIRKRERSPVIEIFKHEESGCGDILLPEFVEWRNSYWQKMKRIEKRPMEGCERQSMQEKFSGLLHTMVLLSPGLSHLRLVSSDRAGNAVIVEDPLL